MGRCAGSVYASGATYGASNAQQRRLSQLTILDEPVLAWPVGFGCDYCTVVATPLSSWASHRSLEVIQMTRGRPPTCPFCGQSRATRKGVRRTKTMGIRRIYRCKACGRKFTPRNQNPQHDQAPKQEQEQEAIEQERADQ